MMRGEVPAASRAMAASGAALAAVGVALSAYAAHATRADARNSLQTAALFAFGHGIALACLARTTTRRLGMAAMVTMLSGTLLFVGALVGAQLLDVRPRTAPFGGALLIAAWLLYAVNAARR